VTPVSGGQAYPGRVRRLLTVALEYARLSDHIVRVMPLFEALRLEQ